MKERKKGRKNDRKTEKKIERKWRMQGEIGRKRIIRMSINSV